MLLLGLILTGCASAPEKRPEYTALPALENGYGRIYVGGGKLYNWANVGFPLWSVDHLGPLFINEKRVWTTGRNEHIAIDLLPGVYEVYWKSSPCETKYCLIQKSAIRVAEGETRYFTSDQMHVTDVDYRSAVTQRPLDGDSKLVSYLKFNQPPTASQPVQQKNSELERLRAEAEVARQRQRQLEDQLNRTRQPVPSVQQSVAPVQVVAPAITDRLSLDASKVKCSELGFKSGTEAFGKCVLQLSK